jgi:hypothetical protein
MRIIINYLCGVLGWLIKKGKKGNPAAQLGQERAESWEQ